MDAQNRARRFAQETACSTAEQGPEHSSEAWRSTVFAEPRGWALRWDRFALSEIRERQGEFTPFPTVHASRGARAPAHASRDARAPAEIEV